MFLSLLCINPLVGGLVQQEVKGVVVTCPQNTELGLACVPLNATPALTCACCPHPHIQQTGGCTGLGSPRGQTGDGQSSQYEDNTA